MLQRLIETTRRHKRLVMVLALAALIRLVYLYLYQTMPEWTFLTIDNYYHHHWAQSIAAGNILGDTTYFRAPFYVFSLAALYALLGSSLWVGRIFGLVIGLVSIGATYRIGERMADQRTGLLAALIQAILPITLYFEAELLLDPLFMLLLQLAALRFMAWLDSSKPRDCLLTGLLLGLAIITRPTALIFVFPAALFIVFRHRRKGDWLRPVIVLMVPIVVIVGAVFSRNLIVAGDPVLVSSQGGINLYIGNNPTADGLSAVLPEPMGHNWRLKQVTHLAEVEMGRTLKPGEISSFWTSEAISWATANPGNFAALYLKKLYFGISNREISNNRSLRDFFRRVPLLGSNPISFGILFALACAGLTNYRHRRDHQYVLLGLIVLSTLVLSFFFFNSRFRLPLIPYYCLLASVGVWALVDSFRTDHRRIVIWSALIVGAFVSFYPLIKLPKGYETHHLISRGLHFYNLGQYRAALDQFNYAQTLDPEFPETHLNIGTCFLKTGDLDSARHHFNLEKQYHPLRHKSYTNLASLCLIEGRYQEAADLAREAISLSPYDLNSNLLLLRATNGLPDFSADSLALIIASAAKATSNHPTLLNEAATIVANRGYLSGAQDLLWRSIASPPPSIETDDLAFERGFPERTLIRTKTAARSYYQLGYIAGLENDPDYAMEYSRQAVALDSNLVEAYINLISALSALRDYHAADSVIAIATDRFGNHDLIRQLILNRHK